MVLDPWLWWVEMIVTVVVSATRDHGFESPVLHEWLPPATPWTYMDSFERQLVTYPATRSARVTVFRQDGRTVSETKFPVGRNIQVETADRICDRETGEN
jgi:hypothetical protein